MWYDQIIVYGYTNPEESIDDHPLLRETTHVFTIAEMITMYNVIL